MSKDNLTLLDYVETDVEATGNIIDTGFPHYEGLEVIIKGWIFARPSPWTNKTATLLTCWADPEICRTTERGRVFRISGLLRKRGEMLQIIPKSIGHEFYDKPIMVDFRVFGPPTTWSRPRLAGTPNL